MESRKMGKRNVGSYKTGKFEINSCHYMGKNWKMKSSI